MKPTFFRLLVFILTLASTSLVHWFNWVSLSQNSTESMRNGITVATADDPSYLAPVENFLDGKGWRSNATGNAAYFTRSPGYSIVYLLFRSWLHEKAALFGLILFQIVFFSVAVSLLPGIVNLLGLPLKIGRPIVIVIALMPTFSGFLSYTLTESITPSLVLVFIFYLLKAIKQHRGIWVAAAVLGLLLFVRPAMLVWVVAFACAIAISGMWRKWWPTLLLALAPLMLWQVYGKFKSGDWQGLHPIYQSDSNDLYRPLHKDVWNFNKSWGMEGVDFHRGITRLWSDALKKNGPERGVQYLLANTDREVLDLIGKAQLRHAYSGYYQTLNYQAEYYIDNKPLPGITAPEAELARTFKNFRSEYTKAYPFKSFIKVPLEIYYRLAAHSNLSLYIFQKTWRGNSWMESLRYISFVIHAGVFLLFPLVFLLRIRKMEVFLIALPIALYLGYLCFVQRGVEERYTLPVLIPMVLVVTAGLYSIGRNKKEKSALD